MGTTNLPAMAHPWLKTSLRVLTIFIFAMQLALASAFSTQTNAPGAQGNAPGAQGNAPGAQSNNFETANALYDQGKFPEAKQLYQQARASGPWTANLFYNLGNTEFRLGDLGQAALNFERALALEPTHQEAARNLQYVREKSGAIVPPKSVIESLTLHLPQTGWILATTGLAWLSVFFGAALFRSRPHTRSKLRWGCVACALLAAGSAVPLWVQSQDQTLAIITAKQTDARLAPADRAALAQTLPAGTRVRIRSERGEWIYCGLPGTDLGWIPANALEKVALERLP